MLYQAIEHCPGLTCRDMYEIYPEMYVDADREQELLSRTDIAVFQHPFYWYNCPPLMKQWLDQVLEKGWAYGEGGDKLRGKGWLQVITTGGREDAYEPEGYNAFTVNELLRPFEATARLCGMRPLEPLVFHGAHHLSEDERIRNGMRYREVLEGILRGEPPPAYSSIIEGGPPA